jgi:hypothetical protein
MHPNKRLLILENEIFTYQKYTEKVKLKRRTKLIFLNFSCKKWKILYNFKIKCHRPLFLYCRCTQSCLPIAVVEIDSCCIVNMIHATHFWMITLPTLDSYIECRNGSDFRMGASTLVQIQQPLQDSIAIWSQMWIQQGKWMACVISPSFRPINLSPSSLTSNGSSRQWGNDRFPTMPCSQCCRSISFLKLGLPHCTR